jgi:TIR domain
VLSPVADILQKPAAQPILPAPKMAQRQVFISYSGSDAFEAELLKYALETMLSKEGVTAWMFQRDQRRSEKSIARSLKERVKESVAAIFLVSSRTLEAGAAQWMELAYADAFEVETFVLLLRLDHQELRSRGAGVPPLLLSSQCNPALEWRQIIEDIRQHLRKRRTR